MNTSPASESVTLRLPDATLEGVLTLPPGGEAMVVFAHGSGSSRFSPRNRAVAEYLNRAGLGTLLFDLLTAEENRIDERTREYRFDIQLLGRRMGQALDWLGRRPDTRELKTGLFGASTGAAAALVAAAERPDRVGAVVSRGGRPDLAGEALSAVRAPTLLIVGGLDTAVIGMNRDAAARLRCHQDMAIVPGATHLFQEPGKLDQVQDLAARWFLRHLAEDNAHGS